MSEEQGLPLLPTTLQKSEYLSKYEIKPELEKMWGFNPYRILTKADNIHRYNDTPSWQCANCHMIFESSFAGLEEMYPKYYCPHCHGQEDPVLRTKLPEGMKETKEHYIKMLAAEWYIMDEIQNFYGYQPYEFKSIVVGEKVTLEHKCCGTVFEAIPKMIFENRDYVDIFAPSNGMMQMPYCPRCNNVMVNENANFGGMKMIEHLHFFFDKIGKEFPYEFPEDDLFRFRAYEVPLVIACKHCKHRFPIAPEELFKMSFTELSKCPRCHGVKKTGDIAKDAVMQEQFNQANVHVDNGVPIPPPIPDNQDQTKHLPQEVTVESTPEPVGVGVPIPAQNNDVQPTDDVSTIQSEENAQNDEIVARAVQEANEAVKEIEGVNEYAEFQADSAPLPVIVDQNGIYDSILNESGLSVEYADDGNGMLNDEVAVTAEEMEQGFVSTLPTEDEEPQEDLMQNSEDFDSNYSADYVPTEVETTENDFANPEVDQNQEDELLQNRGELTQDEEIPFQEDITQEDLESTREIASDLLGVPEGNEVVPTEVEYAEEEFDENEGIPVEMDLEDDNELTDVPTEPYNGEENDYQNQPVVFEQPNPASYAQFNGANANSQNQNKVDIISTGNSSSEQRIPGQNDLMQENNPNVKPYERTLADDILDAATDDVYW